MSTTAKLSDLVIDARFQQRVRFPWKDGTEFSKDSNIEEIRTIAEYAEKLKSGEQFPPIEVFEIEDGKQAVVDGYMRTFAHRLCGKKEIEIKVVGQGTTADAILWSCHVNEDHGLKRTPEDRVHAVLKAESALKSKGERLSLRRLAEAAKVSHQTVKNILDKRDNPAPRDEKPKKKKRAATNGQHEEEPEETVLPGTGPVLTDAKGSPIPEENATLRQDFEAGRYLRLAENSRRQMLAHLLEAKNRIKSTKTQEALQSMMDHELERLFTKLEAVTPEMICDECHGEGCKTCKGQGYLTKTAAAT